MLQPLIHPGYLDKQHVVPSTISPALCIYATQHFMVNRGCLCLHSRANAQLAVKQRKQTKKHKYSDLYHKNTDSEETVSADCPGLIMRSIRQDFFLH